MGNRFDSALAAARALLSVAAAIDLTFAMGFGGRPLRLIAACVVALILNALAFGALLAWTVLIAVPAPTPHLLRFYGEHVGVAMAIALVFVAVAGHVAVVRGAGQTFVAILVFVVLAVVLSATPLVGFAFVFGAVGYFRA